MTGGLFFVKKFKNNTECGCIIVRCMNEFLNEKRPD